MKINLDTEYLNGMPDQGSRIHNDNNIYKQQAMQNQSVAAGATVLSQGFMQDMPMAYSDKEPVTDMAAALSATDVQLKTDYMSVMSLSMSDEDYAEMVRTGQAPEDMDASDSVTILDDIKAALIKGGTLVSGYTDDVDAVALEAITGSKTMAAELLKRFDESGINADEVLSTMSAQDVPVTADNLKMIADSISLATEALPLSDDAAAYLVENSKSPTVENVYQASNAGASGSMGGRRYYSEDGYVGLASGNEALTDDLEALKPQIEDAIRRAGLEVNDETLSDAKLLISHNIPLTPETLLELDNLKELRLEQDPDRLAASVSIAMSAGITGSKANLTYDESIYIRADELMDAVSSIPERAADEIIANGEILNLRNLQRVYEDMTAAGKTLISETEASVAVDTSDLSADQIHARRVLEEVRITMSVEANRFLLRNNYRIDIAPMEELVNALKEAENALAVRLFADEDESVSLSRMQTYTRVKDELAQIPSMPAAILGQTGASGRFIFAASESYDLHEVYESGSIRREAYIRAEESYEALMTAPRRDMGDSIQKAFRNVDDILNDLNLETDETNRRAVRILGYNSIEISVEKIELVREADLNLRGVLNRLTPERVLGMIRDGVNPLNMPIQELSEYLDGQDSDPERKAADYARFLMQLERQNEITDLERDSYIGIYRMLSKLDRTDDAALGRLLTMGLQTSFSGLLSAMRSMAKSGMDYTIDDDFGGVDSLREGAAIDEQISAAFTTGRFAQSESVNETVIENLLMSGEKVSPDNLDALNALKNKRGDWFKPLTDRIRKGIYSGSSDSITALSDSVIDSLTDPEEALEAYSSMLSEVKTDLSDMTFEADSYLDVKALQVSMKQINILGSLARDEVYDLPTEIDGEFTSIRLTIRHESGAGRVSVSMTTVSIGVVAAEFSLKGNMSGYIAYEQPDAFDRLMKLVENLGDDLGFKPELVHSGHINLDKFTDGFFNSEKNKEAIKEKDDSSDINNIELYRVAKTFISALKAI